jgi:hypothetical protein
MANVGDLKYGEQTYNQSMNSKLDWMLADAATQLTSFPTATFTEPFTLYCSAECNIEVVMANGGNTVTFPGVKGFLPILVTKVNSVSAGTCIKLS